MTLKEMIYAPWLILAIFLTATPSFASKHISVTQTQKSGSASGRFISIQPKENRPFPNIYIIRTVELTPKLVPLPQTAATTIQGQAVDIGLGCTETRIMGLVVHGSCDRFVLHPKAAGYSAIEAPQEAIVSQAAAFGINLGDPRSYVPSQWHQDAPWILGLGLFSYLLVTSRLRNIRIRRRARYRGGLPYHLKYGRKGHQVRL